MQIASSINQDQCSGLLAAQACRQDLCYSSSQAIPHEYNICEIEVLQEIRQHICMAPDRGICWPGMLGLTIAEHIEGVDCTPKSGELRHNTLPDEGPCWNIVQQNDGSIRSMLCTLN